VGRIVDQLGRPMRRTGDNHKGRNYQKVLPITWAHTVTYHLDRSAGKSP